MWHPWFSSCCMWSLLWSPVPIRPQMVSDRQCLSGPTGSASDIACQDPPDQRSTMPVRPQVISDRQCLSGPTSSAIDNACLAPCHQPSTMPVRTHVISHRQCLSGPMSSAIDNACLAPCHQPSTMPVRPHLINKSCWRCWWGPTGTSSVITILVPVPVRPHVISDQKCLSGSTWLAIDNAF
jgi:hypothetical protein